jgi:hypothetical protein
MNDPGVNPSKEPMSSSTAANAPVSTPAELEPSHMASKPLPTPKMPGQANQDANGQPPPDVAVHQEGDNTIQEYRQNGHVYMVVVTPKVRSAADLYGRSGRPYARSERSAAGKAGAVPSHPVGHEQAGVGRVDGRQRG